jgi:LysR family hydrogen peroxide-inducible transcriptional activator
MEISSKFSITQLEYVIAVQKHGHFAKAAEACHVTQPTLSMQIQKLEESIGVIIFDRSKKPILLTEIGQKLVEQFQAILFEVKKVDQVLKNRSSKIEGELLLGIIPTIAPYLLPKLLPHLEKQYPGLLLKIQELQTSQIITSLENDEIDVGLLATPLQIDKLFELPLYYEPFSVMCKKGHRYSELKKIKYSSLKYDDIWLLSEGHCLRNQVMDICDMKTFDDKNKKYKFESGSLETIKNLVESYGGYTLLPALATDSMGVRSRLIPFERPIPAREIGLVYRREHYKNDLIEALAEVILTSIPEEIRKIRPKDLDVLPIS